MTRRTDGNIEISPKFIAGVIAMLMGVNGGASFLTAKFGNGAQADVSERIAKLEEKSTGHAQADDLRYEFLVRQIESEQSSRDRFARAVDKWCAATRKC